MCVHMIRPYRVVYCQETLASNKISSCLPGAKLHASRVCAYYKAANIYKVVLQLEYL